jgi:hypothetical protein
MKNNSRPSLKDRINKAANDTFNCLQTGEEIKIKIYSDAEALVIKKALANLADNIDEEMARYCKENNDVSQNE